jgi:hypothetical protein
VYINRKNIDTVNHANIANFDGVNKIVTGATTILKNHDVDISDFSDFLSAHTSKLNTFNISILYIIIKKLRRAI